ncbi:peptidoglycan recognition protein family protein [Allonocardiopsis opalescens]|uniref:N-acetylmuramoyl-L-alanine amidase n=1 Tax=Allonocardiopsis opalescens TaxID=1144618 RepID=A0A2T0Q6S7_9ACTN|nr:peptidoglycan recognition family protein [Allonocardiopsis opalescens]PRX99539.1 N-acetylmuramoyl-L-alanine amidase [Allonocardiopsis opalescens]
MSHHEFGHADRRTLLRNAVLVTGGALLVGPGGVLAPAGAAAAAEPRVRTRADWGARPPTTAATVLDSRPAHIVVHHTATANQSDTSWAAAAALSRRIQDHHMDGNGWADAGQQLTISRGGHIMEGRNRSLEAVRSGRHVVGAHVANHNATALGIENEGTYTSATPPGAMFDALVETCVWLCRSYRLDPHSAIRGHRDFNATACPGDELYAMLPRLRERTASGLAERGVRIERAAPLPAADRPGFPDLSRVTDGGPRVRPFQHGPTIGPRDLGR